MIVISDTSPLNYLVLTDLADILPALFGHIVVPPAVLEELSAPAAPDQIRRWLAKAPAWLVAMPAGSIDAALTHLDAGEREVIALAQQLGADLVLLDEAKGRKAASQRGLKVAGTLAVVDRAAARGLVDLPEALRRLRRTSFRASPQLLKSLTVPERSG